MEKKDYEAILQVIKGLPSGGITYKTINGKRYAYYQWSENGKQHSRRAKDEELPGLYNSIEKRKELEAGIRDADFDYNKNSYVEAQPYQFHCAVRMGGELEKFSQPVAAYKKRELYTSLENYIYGKITDRVFILYGLRRTGKTTLIRQLILNMSKAMKSKTAFVQVQDKTTLSDINQDLKFLESQGYEYIFIDEVTLLEDFIEGAALFSDVFASSGMKIVLSGTDSLGFIFSEDEELFDRCIMCHTTFIPYREFEKVLGLNGINNYIRYGGTMSLSGTHYNRSLIFSSKKTTDEYVDSAIAKNIQHSLKHYQNENHFRSLKELYLQNELTNVINRVVEDINHRFTIEVLTKDFKSNDLSLSQKNLRKDKNNPTDILDTIDFNFVNKTLKELLEIKNRNEQLIEITDSHRSEIKEYLELLDLISEVEIRWMTDLNHKEYRTVFTQPGLRYSQAEALIISLMEDEKFRTFSIQQRKFIIERIKSEIKGRMMEDMILLETKISRPDCDVFKLQFAVGEFDMVVVNNVVDSCQIYEIKHSSEITREQVRHLIDKKKCEETEFRYGTITGKYLIYSGKTCQVDDIQYLNVEEYLLSL